MNQNGKNGKQQWKEKLAINVAGRVIVEMLKKGWRILLEILSEDP